MTERDTRPVGPRRLHEIAHFDLETDVAVVGLGCAGACAALEASAAGAEVLVLERAGGGGGTSALSGGLLYLGGGTPVQKACGFEDTPDDMFRFLMAASGPGPDEAKLRQFCDGSVEHFHWLVQQGVPFKESFYPEPGMEPPTDDCLVYSGGEDAWPFDRIARPAPRAHKARTPGAAGAFLMQCLLGALARTSATVHTGVRCEQLVVDDADGRVVGIVARSEGRATCVRAHRGVVLTAGGFIQNEAMVARHAPLLAQCSMKIGVDGDDGSGIRMGQEAGGAVARMEAGEVAIPVTPPRRLMRGVLVNGRGQRFINEDTYYGRIGQAIVYHQEGTAWLVADDATYEVNRVGMQAAHVADSIEALERELEMPEGVLQSTLAHYNHHAREGRDPLFHKTAELVTPLVSPPYAAIDCRTSDAVFATFTLGGLVTSPEGAVLTPAGAPVPGLYAAGRTTSGVAALGYASGVSLADGTWFGRAAGRSAAQNLMG